ncbi:MAG: rRNA pseudouridine synthase [Oscillatoriales cyanobacterium SM2_1_8]|nr:rRNA pseudouridine synthase [Oscillatoriales cyanobacterium SM2_1_8]
MAERLQKILSRYGLVSRREAERVILAGRVTLNGQVVRELGTKADPDRDRLCLDGVWLGQKPPLVYWLLHKPVGYLCTRSDPEGRPTVYDLLPPAGQALRYVGRLDFGSSGALLLTNDGEWAQRLTHPRHGLRKQYRVVVAGRPTPQTLAQWRSGVVLDGRPCQPATVTVLQQTATETTLQIGLGEGRNRQIRRTGECLGHPVRALHREAIGSLGLGDLPPRCYRVLTAAEVSNL